MLKQKKINLLKKKKFNSFFFLLLFLLIFLYQDGSTKHLISCGETTRERVEWSEERTRQQPPFTAGSGTRKCGAREASLPWCWWAVSSVSTCRLLSLFFWSCGGSQLALGQPVGRVLLATVHGAGITWGASCGSWGTVRWWRKEIQPASSTAHTDTSLYINCAERKEWDLAQQQGLENS